MGSSKVSEKYVQSFIRDIFNQHNITESDYDLIYNLTGREASKLLENDEYTQEPVNCYCNQLRNFSLAYGQIHGYASFVVCVVGVISNVLNIIVLTKREMSVLPINRILRGLAICDVILMVEYIPFIFFYYIRLAPNLVHSYTGAMFVWLHVNFIQIMHTISIFMTLALACWRYSAIRYPQRNVNMSSDEKCNRCIAMAFLLPFVFCLPAYLIFSVQEKTATTDSGSAQKMYALDFSQFALSNNEFFFYLYFWLYFVIIKLVPCAVLGVITCWLIKTLRLASERRDELKFAPYDVGALQHRGLSHDGALLNNSHSNVRRQRNRSRIDRTTNILVAVLTLFVVTELPQGILGLLSVVFGKQFFKTCYVSLGDLMDILALFNGAVDFILYCIMSKQFRKTFGQLFKPKILSNLIQTQEMEVVTTNV